MCVQHEVPRNSLNTANAQQIKILNAPREVCNVVLLSKEIKSYFGLLKHTCYEVD